MGLGTRRLLAGVSSLLMGTLSISAVNAQNIPSLPGNENDKGFVVLNSGIAAMAQQAYGLPKDTNTYPLAGMTIFPYYQASAPLKAFLETININGKPVTAYPMTPARPQISLPATDLINRSIPLHHQPYQSNRANKMAEAHDKKMKDEVPWMVAHDGGQAFQIPGDSDGLALVAPGSMFSACAARTMVLRCGRMWIMTGARPAAVLTKDGAIAVKPYSVAAIEGTWHNQLRITNLYGQPLEVQLAFDGKTDKVSVDKGNELSVVESLVANAGHMATMPTTAYANNVRSTDEKIEAEFACTHNSSVINTSVPGLQVNSATIEPRKSDMLRELTAITPPFNNPRMFNDFTKMFSSFGITPAIRRAEIQKQYLQKNNLSTKTAINKLAQRSANNNNTYIASAPAQQATFPQTSEELKSLRLPNGSAKYLSNSEVTTEQNGRVYFNTGEAVFVADKQLVIRTNTFTVHMRAGSTVQMVARKDVILVRNLGEAENNSVKIRLGDHIFDCGVGGELIAGNSAPILFDEMSKDGIARRNLQSTEANSGNVLVNKSEVSLTSLLQNSPIMRKIYKSKDASDKRLVTDLMKTIVSLNVVTGARGQYRRMASSSGIH